MAYIKVKKCKCGCGRSKSFGYNGYHYLCAPQDIKDKVGSKRKLSIKKKNARVAASGKLMKELYSEDKVKLDLWHRARRYEATGFCQCGCGQTSSKYDDNYYKFSNCHILPKAYFESVKLHPLNCIELSYWNGCHKKFDASSEHWDKLKCWPEIVRRFKILYPLTTPEEHRHIPVILLKTIDAHNQAVILTKEGKE